MFSGRRRTKVVAASTVGHKLLEFSGSREAVFNYIHLQLVLIKPGPPCVDTLAVMLQGWLAWAEWKGGVLVNPTGSSDIGVRRTQCDLGWNMTLGTRRGMEAGKREERSWEQKSVAQMTSDGSAGYEPHFCLFVENLPCRPEAHLYSWGYISLSHTQADTDRQTPMLQQESAHTHPHTHSNKYV